MPPAPMPSFFRDNGGNSLRVKNARITEAVCDELEETKSSWCKIESCTVTGCYGDYSFGKFLNILLRRGCCSHLRLSNMHHVNAEDTWTSIGAAIGSSPTLRHLVIDFANFPRRSMAGLARGLRHAKNLEQFFLRSSEWEQDDDNDLSFALMCNQGLKVLNLSGCRLSDERVSKFVRAIPCFAWHSKLEEFHLSGNKLSQKASEALSQLLKSPESTLKELYLDGYFSRNRTKLNLSVLAEALKHNRTLKTLHLSDNLINDQDLAALASALIPGEESEPNNCSLEKLILPRNCITNAGFSRFLNEFLPRIRGLKTLVLWGNLMEDTSASRNSREVLNNRLIKSMVDLEDVELLKAVALPEHVPVGLWPRLLHRTQQIHNTKIQQSKMTNKSTDSIFLMLRGPMMMSALSHHS